MRRTKNDQILSDYFNNKSLSGDTIPFMTKISKDTGVSVATISRFALRKGFYNFAEMRAKFNTSLDNEDFSDKGLLNFIKKAKKHHIYIVSSKSTRILAYHLEMRLESVGIKTSILVNNKYLVDDYKELEKDARLVFFSISGDTVSFHKWVETNQKNEVVFISTIKTKAKSDFTNFITLSEYKPMSSSKLDACKSVNQMFNWLDKILNIYQIDSKKR